MEGFRDHITPNWDDAIIRIQDQELLLLHGLPLIALVRFRTLQVAEAPATHLPELQRLLRAPLLDSDLLRALAQIIYQKNWVH